MYEALGSISTKLKNIKIIQEAPVVEPKSSYLPLEKNKLLG